MRKEVKIAGLEKIAPLTEHSDGTVFRGKRLMEVDTIIKVLPDTVDINKKDDPRTAIYLREVKRLKHLNQISNIHVVKTMNTGLTEGSSLPFIESELITGPDLEELLNFPNDAIFKIDRVIDLATQMADALAHCHKAMVKHGRINSCNIRLNSNTGSYTLLNFGSNLLTDEQRKALMKEPEYLAPEQHDGELLFETDIYSLGLILFQALTGTLPQRKVVTGKDSPEDLALPVVSVGQQIKELRHESLPVSWTDEEKQSEMSIPVWLQNMVAICLQVDPSKRYGNGVKLQEAIRLHAVRVKEITSPVSAALPVKPDKIEDKAIPDSKSLPDKPKENDEKDAEIKRLKALIIQKEGQLDVYKYQTADYNPDSNKFNIPKPVFFTLLALIAALGTLAAYAYFFRKPEAKQAITYRDPHTTGTYDGDSPQYMASEVYNDSLYKADSAALVQSLPPLPGGKQINDVAKEKVKNPDLKKPSPNPAVSNRNKQIIEKAPKKSEPRLNPEPDQNPEYYEPREKRSPSARYSLAVSKAYLYDKPDVRTRRPIYLASSSNSELTASEDSNGFIYVVFFNTDRQITKGWLRKVDLHRIN